MRFHRDSTLGSVYVLVIVVLLLGAPSLAHADGLGAIAGAYNFFTNPLDGVLTIFITLIQLLQSVAAFFISLGQTLLLFVLQMKASTNLVVVDASWKILRDMCNMLFIVVLVLIAFATVFNVMGIWKRFYWKTALMPLLVGAILINFSLAIGKTVVLVSDQVMQVFINIQKGVTGSPDLGNNLIAALHPNTLLITNGIAGSVPTDISQLNNAISNLTATEQARLAQCETETKAINNTSTASGILLYEGNAINDWANSILGDPAQGVLGPQVKKTYPDCIQEMLAARVGTVMVQRGQQLTTAQRSAYNSLVASSAVAGDTQDKILMAANGVLNVLFLFMLFSCLLTAGVFLLLRIIVVWALLFLSPLAWLAYAIGNEGFQKWWRYFMAWNVFGPLYLFLILPGMIMIRNADSILTFLATKGAGAGILGGLGNTVSLGMFYGFALIIFMGALYLAINSGSAAAIKATPIVGRWAQNLGVFDRAALAPLRGTAEVTGLADRYRGAVQGISSKVTQIPFVGTQARKRRSEELTAKYASRFGDKGAYEDLQRKRIQEEIKKLDEKGISVKDMQDKLSKATVGSTEYFALGQALLKEGELSGRQMEELAGNAGKFLGSTAQNAIRQNVAKKVAEQVKEKKFKGRPVVDPATGQPVMNPATGKAFETTASEVAAEAFLSLSTDAERDKFLRDLKKNDIVLYSQVVSNGVISGFMLARGIDVDSNTGRVYHGEDILKQNLSKLDAESIGGAMEVATQKGWTLTSPVPPAGQARAWTDFEKRRDELLAEKGNYFKVVDNAKGAERAALVARAAELKIEAQALEQAKIVAQANAQAQALAALNANPPTTGSTQPRRRAGFQTTPPPPAPSTTPAGTPPAGNNPPGGNPPNTP